MYTTHLRTILALHRIGWWCAAAIVITAVETNAQIDPSTTQGDIDLDTEVQYQIEAQLEEAELEDGSFDFDTHFEGLERLARQPINLNTATLDQMKELIELAVVSSIQAEAIMEYRRKYGTIFTLYELQGIPTLDPATVQRLLPFVVVTGEMNIKRTSIPKMLQYGKRQMFVRWQRILQTQKGFTPLPEGATGSRFAGSPDRLYMRFRHEYKDQLSFGFTAEKDPGEEFFRGSNRQGFDFYSVHLQFRNINRTIRNVVIGDYGVFLGQGLVMWTGFGIRKGIQATDLQRRQAPLRAYTSVNEALFLRGAATTLRFGHLDVTAFGSHRFRDANLEVVLADSIDEETVEASSLQISGLHRTPSEIADRNAIQLWTTGASARYRADIFNVSFNTTYNRLSVPLRRANYLYNRYRFEGQQLLNASVDYSLLYHNTVFYGETALSGNGGWATLNGLTTHLDDGITVALVHRHYTRDYHTLWGNAFAESVAPTNESGLYLGTTIQLGALWTFNGYFDIFRFPWLRTNLTDAPTKGHEYMGRLQYNPNRKTVLYCQWRHEVKEQNMPSNTTPFDFLTERRITRLRLHLSHVVSRQWEVRNRVELSQATLGPTAKGIMFYQDIIYSPDWLRSTRIQARIAVFDTDNFLSAIYAYENDVLYSFSVPAYYGRGMRWYINSKWEISRHLTLWVRYAHTYFADRQVISSGLNEITGDGRSDVRVQLRYKF